MTVIRKLIPVILILCIFLSGCLYIDGGEDDTIAFDKNITQTNTGEVRITGWVSGRSYGENNTISNFEMLLYNTEKNLIHRERLGTYYTGRSLRVNVTVNKKPKYIIFSSPDIWESDPIAVQYFVLQSDGYYKIESTGGTDPLPVALPEDQTP
ncbi:hypothetical protein [Halorhabdus amylolytica]|uniref:hypothetical protein n=1 Tax=Halorhabdus amylolytica TaxID=2559573 RepID=UPI0010A9DE51|nr:hypothetical protein [Halorhabdus amylolytica]